MILNYLLITLISAIIFSLLIPPPNIENARAAEFDDDAFPKATENSPIPYLIGKARMDSPNTLFAGNFRAVPIKKKIKTGLFSSKKIIVGYKYYLTIDLGLCLGGDVGVTLHAIYIDDAEVWSGTRTDDTPFTISKPELFGGKEKGGGFVSTCRFYPGTFNQIKDPYIDALPETNGLLTRYKGISHIVFEDAYVGESPTLKKIGFLLSRFTNELDLVDSKEVVELTTVNVAEALYAGMTDDWAGMGINEALIDKANFTEMAELVYTENNGAAGIIYREMDGKRFAQEMLRQVDAVMGIDQTTNKITVKPLRFDYDPDDLATYDENQIISIDTFSQTLWTELISQVKVGFKDETNDYQDATAVDQDIAIANITGRMKTTSVTMPFVKKPALATAIAGRELNQLSKPATTATFTAQRSMGGLTVGSVFKWSWDDYNISNMILRVKNVTSGSDDDGSIKFEVVKDPYGELYTTFAEPSGGPSDPLTIAPLPVTEYEYLDAPPFLVTYADMPIDASVGNPSVLLLLPIAANISSQSVSALIDDENEAFTDLPFPTVGLLQSAISITDDFATGVMTSLTVDLGDIEFPTEFSDATSTEVKAGANLIYINGEVLGFETYTDNLDGTYTLETVHRALLNTKQQSHAAGDYVFLLDDISYLSISTTDESESPAEVIFIPSSGPIALDPDYITPISIAAVGAYTRPDPPDYTTVETARSISPVTGGTTLTIDWRPRLSTLGTIQFIADAADTVSGMTYDLYLFNISAGGGSIYSSLGIVGTTHEMLVPTGIFNDTLEIRIYSVVDGRTSVTYDWFRFDMIPSAELLLEGDMQSGTDKLLLEGDMQSGTDVLRLEGDME
jgi:hypothetical protein